MQQSFRYLRQGVPTKRTSVNLPQGLVAKLDAESTARLMSVSSIVVEALEARYGDISAAAPSEAEEREKVSA